MLQVVGLASGPGNQTAAVNAVRAAAGIPSSCNMRHSTSLLSLLVYMIAVLLTWHRLTGSCHAVQLYCSNGFALRKQQTYTLAGMVLLVMAISVILISDRRLQAHTARNFAHIRPSSTPSSQNAQFQLVHLPRSTHYIRWSRSCKRLNRTPERAHIASELLVCSRLKTCKGSWRSYRCASSP